MTNLFLDIGQRLLDVAFRVSRVRIVTVLEHLLPALDLVLKLTGPGKIWLQSLSLPLLADALQPYLPKPQRANGVSLKLG